MPWRKSRKKPGTKKKEKGEHLLCPSLWERHSGRERRRTAVFAGYKVHAYVISMEFSAVNRRRPSRETPLGPGAKKDGCFRRLVVNGESFVVACPLWRFVHTRFQTSNKEFVIMSMKDISAQLELKNIWSAYEVKNNCCLFERLLKVKRMAVFFLEYFLSF